MRISHAQASKLLELQRGASLKRSEIQKGLCEGLLKRGAIRLQRAGAGYRIVGDPEKFSSILELHYSIRDLEAYVALGDTNDRSRAELTRTTGNSKALPVAPMRGLYFGVLGKAEIFIDGKSARPQPGTALFVPAGLLNNLKIHPARILGIENVEAFLKSENLHLPIPSQAVTVLRWNWGEQWKKWVNKENPEVFYAGDYDWAGVAIFEREVIPVSPEATFLVPDDLKERLKEGNASLFVAQEEKYRNYEPISTQGAMIYNAVKAARKGLEQEALLR
jgi:hypothetical protein